MHLSDLLLQGVIIENLGDLRFEEVMSALLYGMAPTMNQAVQIPVASVLYQVRLH